MNAVIALLGTRDGTKLPLSSIRNTSDLRSWFFSKYLSDRGYSVDFYRWDWEIPTLKRPVDHFICTVNAGGIHRLSEKHKVDVCKLLKLAGVKKYVIDMSDNAHADPITDKYLSMIPLVNNTKSSYVGWAADDRLLKPEKTDKFRILIDHPIYMDFVFDASEKVIQGLEPFKNDSSVEVYQIDNSGLVKIDLSKPYKKDIYDRHNQIPYPDICSEYNKSNIFIVTHAESLGLSVIESAMAGAHILCYKTAIKQSLLNPLSYSFYDQRDSTSITKAISDFRNSGITPEQVRSKAMPWTWTDCINRLEKILRGR